MIMRDGRLHALVGLTLIVGWVGCFFASEPEMGSGWGGGSTSGEEMDTGTGGRSGVQPTITRAGGPPPTPTVDMTSATGSPPLPDGSSGAGGGGPEDKPPPEGCETIPQESVPFYMSSDDSNSMASPAYARDILRQHRAPLPTLIRTYEFLNYYNVAYEAPPAGSLSVVNQMATNGTSDDLLLEHYLQVGVQAGPRIEPRPPMTITFVVDTSRSMAGNSLKRAKAAVKAIASRLQMGDKVSLTTWDSEGMVLDGLKISGPDDTALLTAAAALVPEGGSSLKGGLMKGYELAEQHRSEQGMNRLVLITDGGARPDLVDKLALEKAAEHGDDKGIYLVGVGTGPALGYNDALLNELTDAGRGAYVYLDSEEEAARIFGGRFYEVMDVAAREVELELTLPWYFNIDHFYGEGYAIDHAAIKSQHLAPGDVMVFNQVLRVCNPEAIEPLDVITATARWKSPYTLASNEFTAKSLVGDLLAGASPQLTKARAIVAYAEALKALDSKRLKLAHETVTAANTENDPELAEIAELIKLHPSYIEP